MLAVWVDVINTVEVDEAGETAREQADLTISAGYLVRTLGVGISRLFRIWVQMAATVGSMSWLTVVLVEAEPSVTSRFAFTIDVMVVEAVLYTVEVAVATTLVTLTTLTVVEIGVVVTTVDAVTTGTV